MFAMLEGHNGCRVVAMVWRADHDRIETVGRFVEHLAVVLEALGRFPLLGQPAISTRLERGNTLGNIRVSTGIDIAVSPANIAMGYRICDVAPIDPAHPDEGDAQLVTLAFRAENCGGAEDSSPGNGS